MPNPHRISVPDSLLIHLYTVEKLSMDAIALRCGIGHETVRKHLHTAGVIIRPQSKLSLKPSFSLAHLTEAQKGYLAGFLDGEGSLLLNKRGKRANKNLEPTISFTNTHKPTMTFLKTLIGFGGIGQYLINRRNPHHKPAYHFTLRSIANVLYFLEVISPYFVTKKKQAQILMQYCRSRQKSWEKGNGNITTHQRHLAARLRLLNQRGLNTSSTPAL